MPDRSSDSSLPPPAEILLVDDDEMIRQVTKLLLETLDIPVSVAASAQEAFERLERCAAPPDVVLLDYCLGDSLGIDVFHRLKELHPQLKVVFFSGLAPVPEVAQLCGLGAAWFLAKPFKAHELAAVIAKARNSPVA